MYSLICVYTHILIDVGIHMPVGTHIFIAIHIYKEIWISNIHIPQNTKSLHFVSTPEIPEVPAHIIQIKLVLDGPNHV